MRPRGLVSMLRSGGRVTGPKVRVAFIHLAKANRECSASIGSSNRRSLGAVRDGRGRNFAAETV
jgi:hypothetical protein